MFVKWVIQGTAAVYLLLVPWTLFGLIIVVCPNWILRMTRAVDKILEQAWEPFEKRPPPSLGFQDSFSFFGYERRNRLFSG